MNAATTSVQQQSATVKALGSRYPNEVERARLQVVLALGVLAVLIALSAYAAIHAGGITVELP
jgi:hypothetical protein